MPFSLFSQQTDWELKKAENGISVFVRTTEDSPFQELKATMKLQTSLASIVAVLSDWDTYPEWVYRCGASKTLKQISETELIHYQTVVAPWPVDSRDFAVRITLSQDERTKTVVQKSTALPSFIPEVPGYVRIRQFKASWTLVPMPDGYVHVEYQLLVDPGGSVPAWLVNLAVVDGPFETTAKLAQRVKMKKYQLAKLPFIKEP